MQIVNLGKCHVISIKKLKVTVQLVWEKKEKISLDYVKL